jgi:predicted dehydrogenase
VLAESHVLRGRRFGNFVLVASPSPLPLEWMPRLLAGGPHPATLVHDRELRNWIAGAPVVTDATALPSPPPNRSVFQLRPGDSRPDDGGRE